jgi:hypothetical protein
MRTDAAKIAASLMHERPKARAVVVDPRPASAPYSKEWRMRAQCRVEVRRAVALTRDRRRGE